MKVKIYEMFMRDGLQSLSKTFTLKKKLQFIDLLNQCNFHCIEFGSTTSPKLLPQMANSFELFESMNKKLNTKYTMLVPGYNQTQKALDNGISSFGLVCSVSEIFAHKNLKKTSRETIDNVKNQIDLITKNQTPHIRVYLSCSFGSPWEDFNVQYLNNLKTYVADFIEYAKLNKISSDNFDVVISDTVGLSSQKRTEEILKMLSSNVKLEDMGYLATHIHAKDIDFHIPIISCIKNNIWKFDSSICGIGGCPFAEDDALGNISTVKLIDFLNNHISYCPDNQFETICYVEKEIQKLMNDT